jgi:Na+/melibiose symporter-like transporter
MAGSETKAPEVSRLQMMLFGFPSLPHAFIAMPLAIVIPTFYAANTSVTLAAIALVTSLTRIADAITDPLIGYLSDRTRSPLGPRKPWVLLATLLCAVSIFFLFQPPADASFVYYGIWSFALYFGFTLFEIPRNAWGAELSRQYIVRARIMGWVSIFSIAGSLVFWLVPIGMSYFSGSTELGASSLTVIAWLYALLMPAGIILAVLFVPSGPAGSDAPPTLTQILTSLRGNRLLHRYFGIVGSWGLGQGAYLSVILIFLSDYLQMAAIFPFLMIGFFAIQIAAMPFWVKMIARYGKHRMWAFSMVADVATRPLILLLVPGMDSLYPMIALSALGAFLNAPANVTPGAMLGDVVDYGIMKHGTNNAGNYFALYTLLVKATMALGAGLAFFMLDGFGYQVGGPNGAGANTGLFLAYLGFPALMYFAAAYFAWTFPLTARRHEIVRRRLERRTTVIPLGV